MKTAEEIKKAIAIGDNILKNQQKEIIQLRLLNEVLKKQHDVLESLINKRITELETKRAGSTWEVLRDELLYRSNELRLLLASIPKY